MSRRLVAVGALLASMAFAGATVTTPADAAAPAPREHRVAMFSDSVGLGARHAVPAAFPADWEVNVVGEPARFVEQLESGPCFWTLTDQRCDVRFRLAANPEWFGDHVVIAAGYNYPHWDPERFERSIDSIIGTLTAAGVQHVYWVTLREIDPQYISASAWRQVQPYYWYFPEVNEHLRAATLRHPNLTLVDWAAAANRSGITYDAIHLNNEGAALYAALIKEAVDQNATAVPAGSTTRVVVPDAGGAAAAAVNLTTTFPRVAGFLTVHRCDDDPPLASVHNYVRAQTVAHAAIAPLDDDGAFCITTSAQTNVIADVTGLLREPGFAAVGPLRVADTRADTIVRAGETFPLDLSGQLTSTDRAVALTVTAVDGAGLGHVTVATCPDDPGTSNVNFSDAAATPNLVVVEPDADGRVCLTPVTDTHLVVDLAGTFADGEITADATRLIDSRLAGGPMPPGGTVRLDLTDRLAAAGTDPGGVVLNLTGLGATSAGHFTAYPCAAGLPPSSNLNLWPGQVAANATIVTPDADGAVCVTTFSSAHLVVDLLAVVGPSFEGRSPIRALDTRTS